MGLSARTLQLFRFYRVGIVKETKNRWECRSPLTPKNIENLKIKWGSELDFVIQPSRKRIFPDDEYLRAGAVVKDDLTDCDLIMGVKEVRMDQLIPNKSYIFFSHTHKGQTRNLPLLGAICAKGITLYDYELIKDPQNNNNRLVAFGKFAGYAGILNAMNGLGDYLLSNGIRTPFLNIPLAHHFKNLNHVHEAMDSFSRYLKDKKISKDANPVVFTFTGRGNVTQGALEIIKHLPNDIIEAKDLKQRFLYDKLSRDRIYICMANPKDYLKRKDTKNEEFDYARYLSHPEEYESHFSETIAPYTSVLVNGIYWEPKYPRLITNEELKAIKLNPDNRLCLIADISCDMEGSLEFVKEISTIDEPFYFYNPYKEVSTRNRAEAQRWGNDGFVQIMSIDNLPTQLPEDSSIHFGNCLEPLIPTFAGLDGSEEVIEKCKITDKGRILKRFSQLWTKIKEVRRVLILGNGYVVPPVIDFLKTNQKMFDIRITVASNDIAEQSDVEAESIDRVKLDVCKDLKVLSELIQQSDLVISLVSANLHVDIAKTCIEKGKSMVTASYISEEMDGLNSAAEDANVLILNEIGLDPGLDHLAAMKVIDDCHEKGEVVESFVSWCGGLPAPETAVKDSENILKYKFSWSPRGVLQATKNPARYLKDGQIIEIPENRLLKSFERVDDLDSMLKFEGIPNRDSLKYIKLYGLTDELRTMFRGTLRFKGFFECMQEFKDFGFLDDLVDISGKKFKTGNDFIDFVMGDKSKNRSEETNWLKKQCGSIDLSGKTFSSLIEGFSYLLNETLKYAKGERDMIFLHHTITTNARKIKVSLCVFGDERFSAMARTVGIPVAVAALKMLEKEITGRGVKAPLEKEIYDSLLKNLPFKFIINSESLPERKS